MRRLLRNISIAYWGPLGDGLPEPPYGYQFLTDDAGTYLTDGLGNYLIGPWHG